MPRQSRLNLCPVRCSRQLVGGPSERLDGALVLVLGAPDEAYAIDFSGTLQWFSPLVGDPARRGSSYTLETEEGTWRVDRQGCRCGGKCTKASSAARALIAP